MRSIVLIANSSLWASGLLPYISHVCCQRFQFREFIRETEWGGAWLTLGLVYPAESVSEARAPPGHSEPLFL